MKVTKINIGRLYNLGSYEHMRYDLTIELADGDSARDAIVGLEKILTALAPERTWGVSSPGELGRERERCLELRHHLASLSEDEFRRRHGHFLGSPKEYVERIEKSHEEGLAKRMACVMRAAKARRMLDDLGGAAHWRDAKLEWECDDSEF